MFFLTLKTIFDFILKISFRKLENMKICQPILFPHRVNPSSEILFSLINYVSEITKTRMYSMLETGSHSLNNNKKTYF